MQLVPSISFALVGAVLANAAAIAPAYTRSETPCPFTKETRYGIAETMLGWGEIWRGNLSQELLDRTLMPNFSLWQDRLPTGNGSTAPVPVNNVDQLLAFIKTSHKDFSEYNVIDRFNFVSPEGDKVAARWTLEGTIGPNSTSPIRKPGDVIYVNGTDIVLFDDCSGRIAQVLTAQDSLSYNQQMGYNIINL